ncbi:MAG: S1/P1 nuclease [Tatlockia sp.]
MARWLLLTLSVLFAQWSYGWNAQGHRLVAQIAYDNMTFKAKQRFNQINHALDKVYKPENLVDSAVWLDTLYVNNKKWMSERHYISLPFSFDGTKLIPPKPLNAVTAIASAKAVLQSDASAYQKGISLRILLHVVGDIHQPLHAATQYSRAFPRGDKGGNRFNLGKNPVAPNLHAYWDRGGGFLKPSKNFSHTQLEKKAHDLEHRWPCHPENMQLNVYQWAQESQKLAITKAYRLRRGTKPTKQYNALVKETTKKQIVLAGCHLAALLNQLAAS